MEMERKLDPEGGLGLDELRNPPTFALDPGPGDTCIWTLHPRHHDASINIPCSCLGN
jgi:hypothetical protein